MKLNYSIAALLLVLMTSCSVSLQKRLYRDGFYITTNHKSDDRITINKTQAKTFEARSYDESPNAVNSVSLLPPEKSITVQPEYHDGPIENSSNEKLEIPPYIDEQASPPGNSPENEMVRIEKLNKNARVFLKMSVIVFPLAFLTLTTAVILSLLALFKIRMLSRAENLNAAQQSQLNEHKKRARKTLWISAGVLVLILLAFFIYLGVSGPFINAGNIPMRI